MGTPSEVAAGIILEDLGFKNIKYVNKSFDYATRSSVIEVKAETSLRVTQMKALAKEAAQGKKAFLLVVSKEKYYCLFRLTSTNLEVIKPRVATPKEELGVIDFSSKKLVIQCPKCNTTITGEIKFPDIKSRNKS